MSSPEESRRYVLLGTAGHIDHGKTALVKLLTGCETDTLREEKERGLTIDLGFAPCELRGDLMACIVDVPGHEKFIRNMVAGASGIDSVLLVVAADDSVMPQTIEHLHIVELLGIEKGLVAVTKIDMVDEEIRELVVEEVRDFLAGTFLENAPICPVSSVTGEGLEDLWVALTEVVEASRDRPAHGIFRMPVERVFSIQGFGTVMTGMPFSGRIEVGDRLELLPQAQSGRLRGLQVYGKDSTTGWAGQCLAMNVSDVDHNSVVRGNIIATPGYLEPARMVEVRLKLLPGADRPLKHQAPVRFHHGTGEHMGRMFLLDRDALHPGEDALAQFRAEEPLIVAPGDRFVIRQYSPVVTIGGGRVVRPSRRKAKRFRDGLTGELEALEAVLDDDRGWVALLLAAAGRTPSRAEDLLRRSYAPRSRLDEVLADLVESGEAVALGQGGSYVSAAAMAGVAGDLRAALARHHEAHPLRRGTDVLWLRGEVEADPVVVEAAVDRMVEAGEAVRVDGLVALPGHDVKPDTAQQALAEKVETILGEEGLTPPEIPDLARAAGAPEEQVRAILGLLTDRGAVAEIGADLYAHAEAEARARKLLVDWLKEKGQIGVVDYRDLLGASRKYVYAYLDHFDAIGLTYRVENLRYLRDSAEI
ncbi:MAG: selenocysteine-specific translation elongation factor [Planctomycetota bacterium]